MEQKLVQRYETKVDADDCKASYTFCVSLILEQRLKDIFGHIINLDIHA